MRKHRGILFGNEKCFILALWYLGIIFSVQSASSEGVIYTNFGAYLTNRTWIKDLEIDLSRNRVKASLSGFTTWRASVQPGGFFIQCASNSPYSAILIFGESTNEYWQTSQSSNSPTSLRGVAVASKELSEGASTNNSRRSMCLFYRQVIKNALNFGIVGLDANHITWISPDEFSTPLLDWIGQPTSGEVHVWIDSYKQNMPTQLRYQTITRTNREEFLIICRYDSPAFPPTETTIAKLVNGHPDIVFTNIIRSIAFGVNENADRGFEPTDFFAEDLIVKNFIIESNGTRYSVKTNGDWRLLNEASTNTNSSSWRLTIIRSILIIFIISPLVVILYRFLVKKQK